MNQSATGGLLRLRGRNSTEHENVRLGAYHTLELGPRRQFTIHKNVWDAVDIDRIKQATDPTMAADLAVVLITVMMSAGFVYFTRQ